MKNTWSVIVRWGLTCGLIMALLGAAGTVGEGLLPGSFITGPTTPGQALSAAEIALLASCGGYLLYLALVFAAGVMTARQTGSVGSGALAGLLAGGVSALVTGAVAVILALVFRHTPFSLGATSARHASDTFIVSVISALISAIAGLLIWSGLGAGLGALGALVGQRQFRAAHPELAQRRLYASAPSPGYPPLPSVGAVPPPPPSADPQPLRTDLPPSPGVYPPPGPFPPSPPGQ
jgi:hypothetical protein